MKIRFLLFVLCAAGLVGQSAIAAQATRNDTDASPPAASAKGTKPAKASHHSPRTPPVRTPPPSAGPQTAVTPNNYIGAQGTAA